MSLYKEAVERAAKYQLFTAGVGVNYKGDIYSYQGPFGPGRIGHVFPSEDWHVDFDDPITLISGDILPEGWFIVTTTDTPGPVSWDGLYFLTLYSDGVNATATEALVIYRLRPWHRWGW
jgi:hypothetical protein